MGTVKRITLVLMLIAVGGWWLAKSAQARLIIDDNWAYNSQPEDSDGNCLLTSNAIVPDYYCSGSKPADDCQQNPWIFYYNAQCVGEPSGDFGSCNYQYGWHRQSCSTADSCISGEHGLRPGICDASRGGCVVGPSIYKTCCNGPYSEACNGGIHTGTCPNTHVWGSGIDADCQGGTPNNWTLIHADLPWFHLRSSA